MKTNSEIRREARELLKGHWGKGALINLVFLLLIIGFQWMEHFLTGLLYRVSPWLSFFFQIAVYSVPMLLLLLWFHLYYRFIKGESLSLQNLFPFLFEKIIGIGTKLTWLVFLFLCLWNAAYMLPISLLMYFLDISEESILLDLDANSPQMLILMTCIVVGLVILNTWKFTQYAMTLIFPFSNSEWTARKMIKESIKRMKGSKFSLLRLWFSFTLWGILCIFTLGLGFFWLYSYVAVSIALFLEDRRVNSKVG